MGASGAFGEIAITSVVAASVDFESLPLRVATDSAIAVSDTATTKKALKDVLTSFCREGGGLTELNRPREEI